MSSLQDQAQHDSSRPQWICRKPPCRPPYFLRVFRTSTRPLDNSFYRPSLISETQDALGYGKLVLSMQSSNSRESNIPMLAQSSTSLDIFPAMWDTKIVSGVVVQTRRIKEHFILLQRLENPMSCLHRPTIQHIIVMFNVFMINSSFRNNSSNWSTRISSWTCICVGSK